MLYRVQARDGSTVDFIAAGSDVAAIAAAERYPRAYELWATREDDAGEVFNTYLVAVFGGD